MSDLATTHDLVLKAQASSDDVFFRMTIARDPLTIPKEFPLVRIVGGSLPYILSWARTRRICATKLRRVRVHSNSNMGFQRLGRIALGTLVCSCFCVAASAPVDVKSLAAAVDAHYNRLQSMEADFTETYRGSGMDRAESGTLWLKKPGKMRWEYRSPKEKLFVSDGKTVWFYVPDDRQARKEPAKKLEDLRSPLAFLLGKTKLEKELHGLSLASDVTPIESGDVILRGVPQGLSDQVNEVLLEITPEHEIRQITLEDVDGSTTEYRFNDQKGDVAVANARFEFRPPAGIEVVEGMEP